MEFDPILENVTISNVIPSFSTVTEDAMYTIASVEESYTNIMKEIGIYELSLVMEEADNAEKNEKETTKNIFQKFGEMVKNFLAKIAELVQKAIDKVEYMIVQKTKAINDIVKISVNDLKKAVEDQRENNPEAYKKAWGSASLKQQIYYNNTYAKDMAQTYIPAAVTEIESELEALNKDSKIDELNIEEKVAKKLSTGTLNITANDIKEIGKFKAKITEALVKYVPVNFENGADTYVADAYKHITSAKANFKDEVKNPYVGAKKKFDVAIKKARKANKSKDFKPLFKSTAQCAKLFSALIGAIETSYIRSLAWDFRVVLKATIIAAAAKKKDKKTATGESAMIESSTFQTELQSLFTFN